MIWYEHGGVGYGMSLTGVPGKRERPATDLKRPFQGDGKKPTISKGHGGVGRHQQGSRKTKGGFTTKRQAFYRTADGER